MTRRPQREKHICDLACWLRLLCGGRASDRPVVLWDIDTERKACGRGWFLVPVKRGKKRRGDGLQKNDI